MGIQTLPPLEVDIGRDGHIAKQDLDKITASFESAKDDLVEAIVTEAAEKTFKPGDCLDLSCSLQLRIRIRESE